MALPEPSPLPNVASGVTTGAFCVAVAVVVPVNTIAIVAATPVTTARRSRVIGRSRRAAARCVATPVLGCARTVWFGMGSLPGVSELTGVRWSRLSMVVAWMSPRSS
jgi:hypothetical protein